MRYTFCLWFLLLGLSLSARTFVREYTYRAGEADSKITARAIALEQVKRLLLEEVGVYISSTITNQETEVNGEVQSLTQKDIQVLSAGITQTKVMQENWNGETYYLKAQIVLDEKDVQAKLDELINDTQKQKLLEDTRLRGDAALAQIDSLKTALAQEQDKVRQMELQKAYNAEAGKLSAIDYYNKAMDSINSADNGRPSFTDETKKWLLMALDADSTYGQAWYYLSQYYYQEEDLGSAKKCLHKSYEYTGDPEDLTALGYIYQKQEDYSTALSYYQQAYDAYQAKPLRYQNSEASEWEKKYEMEARLDPLNKIAELYVEQGNQEGALEVYQRILAINPNDFTALLNAAYVNSSLKRYDEAIRLYSYLHEVEPTSTGVLQSLADVYEQTGGLETAVRLLEEAKSIDPEDDTNTIPLVSAYYRTGRYNQSIALINAALSKDPQDGYLTYMLAMNYAGLNDTENCRKYHVAAAKLNFQSSIDWCKSNGVQW